MYSCSLFLNNSSMNEIMKQYVEYIKSLFARMVHRIYYH